MRSLAVRLTLAFLGIAIVAVGLVAVLARWATFDAYDRLARDAAEERFITLATQHYTLTGTWQGVEGAVLPPPPAQGQNPPPPLTMLLAVQPLAR